MRHRSRWAEITPDCHNTCINRSVGTIPIGSSLYVIMNVLIPRSQALRATTMQVQVQSPGTKIMYLSHMMTECFFGASCLLTL